MRVDKNNYYDRIYKCEKCGNIIDRDYNASLNIKEYGTDLIEW